MKCTDRLLLALKCLTLFQIVVASTSHSVDNVPVVSIPELGSIRGSVMESAIDQRKFQAFRGIPYARPPVGDLRFQDPLPAAPWKDRELDATTEGPSCVQYDTFARQVYGVEDCLVLNIYTPSVKGTDGGLNPVMIWIPGGGFIRGDGNGENGLYGPEYFMDRDIVLVTINYRVGAFGFLSTHDAEAPGNYGLLDQVLAMKWVNDNIMHFGGDRDSITIFGESAGGACVEFHLLTPHSKGLFHRAIAQSGASTATWAVHNYVNDWTVILAQETGCPTENSKDLLSCLRKTDAKLLAEFRTKITLPYAYELFPLAFGPRIDSEHEKPFLPSHPLDLLAEGKFNKVPFIAGVTKNEGIILTSTLIGPQNEGNMNTFQDDPINGIRHFLSMEKRPNGKEIAQLIHDKYLTSSKAYIDQMRELEQLVSDTGFFKPLELSLNLISNNSDQPVYTYLYCYSGTFSYYSIIGAPPDPDNGVGHGDELMFMFGSSFAPKLNSSNDLTISETLIDLFTSFAIEGKPKSGNLNEEWKPYNNHKRYLQIGSVTPGEEVTATKMVDGDMPFHNRTALLDEIFLPKQTTGSQQVKKDEL